VSDVRRRRYLQRPCGLQHGLLQQRHLRTARLHLRQQQKRRRRVRHRLRRQLPSLPHDELRRRRPRHGQRLRPQRRRLLHEDARPRGHLQPQPRSPVPGDGLQLLRREVRDHGGSLPQLREVGLRHATESPAAGAGAHKLIPNSGWDPAWNGDLESNPQTFRSALKCGAAGIYTWSDAPGAIEDEPICCETWYEAFAFCAWQGGRLPTEAELHYLQVGGSEQRPYPWGLGPPTNISYTVYDCIYDGSAAGQCAGSDLPPVGSVSPLGDGKWGQVDLTGSVVEWVRDTFKAQMLKPCADCARMEDPLVNGIVSRGGAYKNQAPFLAMSGQSARLKIEPDFRTHCAYGIRCAFDP
jgi:hypothetical protein